MAEVRAIAYIAKDKYMLDCYAREFDDDGNPTHGKGIDPYINLAKLLRPGMPKSYYKGERATYKILLLGSIYGMSPTLMAQNSGLSVEECEKKQSQMFEMMSGIKRVIEEKGAYCVEHRGRVETVMGDTMQMQYEPDRWARLGKLYLCSV